MRPDAVAGDLLSRARRHLISAPGGTFKATSLTGCALWVRGSLGITLNGSNVSAWADQSGNGRNLTQGTGAKQPLYVASAQNGQSGVRFDGVAQYLQTATFTLAQPMTWWVVVKQISWTLNAYMFANAGGAGPATFHQAGSSPDVSIHAGNDLINTGLPLSTYGIVSMILNSTSSIQVGNQSPVTGSAGVAGIANGVGMGAFAGTPSAFSNVEICEAIIYDHQQSAGDLATVLAGLRSLYGL